MQPLQQEAWWQTVSCMLPRPARPARREGRGTLRPGEARTVDGPCVGQRHVLGVDGQVARQLVAAQRLYAPQCRAVDGAAMAEVKAQPLRLNDGPLLVYVISEHLHATRSRQSQQWVPLHAHPVLR